MHTLTTTRTIPAPIDDVFEAYIDHEKFSQVPLVRSCELTRRGDTEKNGLGAVRELDCGPFQFREEITGFDRPHRMEYRIRESRPSLEHTFGRVDLAEVPGGTLVIWTTVFGVRVPVVGKLVDPVFGIALEIAFGLILCNVEKRAIASAKRR
ncbi:SRPBCC family protein [Saccharopolyspora sp. WRP15-2]|uniref:SRPBCC family protein n=1 Tax=Saccharopolyspora oryzae TaxID=2997343 RepID=A0ABT4V0P9_9PSEU|nr:SRPBCC family protein [Saccharopolyspora oryzae]MDA3627548.1 SRPBCC family protein [Saccharopolyspora oryzae]